MRSRWTRPPSRRTSHTVHIQYEVPSLSPPHPPESTTRNRCNGNRRWHEMEVAAIFGLRVLWPQYHRLVVVVAWSWWMEAWSGRCRQHQSSERMEADGLEIRNLLNFGEYNMLLAAENRVFLRSTGGSWMTTMPKHSNMEWVHWRKLDDNNAQTFKPSC
ncbi:hypothetical protein LXL04_003658 [Taraxacum kok-saghyz]